jgi:DNA-binding winged helix-turn-helix (wHTH) protein
MIGKSGQLIVFEPFRLDPVNERLWRGTELLAVRPKPFALLRYLARYPGRLVTKEELNKAVWPDTVVGESSLKGYIRDLREVLGDDPEAPTFIETVARPGTASWRRGSTAPRRGLRRQHRLSRRPLWGGRPS